MQKWIRPLTSAAALTAALTIPALTAQASTGYSNHPEAQTFISEMAEQGFDKHWLKDVLDQARRQESILKAMSRPAERRLTWGEYRKIFLGQKRIDQGVAFWKKHASTLAKAEKQYGVPAEIIVAIIGVETRYGRNMGSYRVLDALTTLGFDYPKRGKFFRGQLKEYLLMAKEEGITDLTRLKGSYAGAMGFGQFIPSSFRHFAVDFDGDGKRDIWTNRVDAIGSVANYFSQHNWKTGEPVRAQANISGAVPETEVNKGLKPARTLSQWQTLGVTSAVTLADQPATLMGLETADKTHYWLGLHNFYVITRYNHSRLYASAVYELSQAVNKAYRKP
ncbi:MAG: lytic murein transglycosylase B [Marinobacterium sp.]|nr:lytic murein transglycosylase B [Marinobacterium sp.]